MLRPILPFILATRQGRKLHNYICGSLGQSAPMSGRALILWWVFLVMWGTVTSTWSDFASGVTSDGYITIALAFLAGLLYLIRWEYRRRRQNRRMRRLIYVPNKEWTARWNECDSQLIVRLRVNILMPSHSVALIGHIRVDGEHLPTTTQESRQMTRSSTGGWILELRTHLSDVPANTTHIDAKMEITLDGETDAVSEWYEIPITDLPSPPPITDREGSQP